jgi:hypothetical protein
MKETIYTIPYTPQHSTLSTQRFTPYSYLLAPISSRKPLPEAY